jgi:hypothetical protein
MPRRLSMSLLSMRAWTGLVFVVAAGLTCLMAYRPWSPRRPDTSRAYTIELGRGSGRHGLDTVRVVFDGLATVCRWDEDRWEMADLILSPDQLGRMMTAVERDRLPDLRGEYRDERVADGTQWVLRLERAGMEKVVYFDNRFPDEVVRFADTLDEILAEAGLEKAAWRPANASARELERALWRSIDR